jgi:hypothetical protein
VIHQACSHGVFKNVGDLLLKILRRTENTSERFILPDVPATTESFVNPAGGLALDGMHDFRDREAPVSVCQRRTNQVRVVRHDYRRMQNAFSSVRVHAGFKSQVSRCLGQFPATIRGESDE